MEDNTTVEESRQQANKRELALREADRRRTRQLHRENAVLWREHFIRMAVSHRKLSEDYEARAEALCEGGDAA